MTQPQYSALPLWARVVDVIAVVVAAAGVSIALFGGFRVAFAGIPITAHGALRPIGMAVLLALVRHFFWRSPSLGARIGGGLRAFFRAESVRAIGPPFLWSRAGVLLIATLSISTFNYPDDLRFRVSNNEVVNLPARWDAGWYLGIAMNGYQYNPRHMVQHNVSFFPAFPLLTRTVGIFAGGHVDDRGAKEKRQVRLIWSGVFVNLSALAVALGYLYRMVRAIADRDVAVAAVSLALAYPAAFIYNAPYTEGLFLLASLATFYHFGRNDFTAAALWGTVVGLTRPNGFFLAAPLVAIALARSGPFPHLGPLMDRLNTRADLPRHLSRDLAVAVTPCLGLLLYCAFLYATWGDPLAWMRVQVAWGRTYQGLEPVLTPLKMIGEEGLGGYAMAAGYDVLNILPFMLAVGASIPIARRLGLAYAMLILLTLLPPLLAGGWLSIARLTVTLFPVYIILALLVPPRHRTGLVVLFALLQSLGASLFFTWRPFF